MVLFAHHSDNSETSYPLHVDIIYASTFLLIVLKECKAFYKKKAFLIHNFYLCTKTTSV